MSDMIIFIFRDFLELISVLEGISHNVSLPMHVSDVHQTGSNQWLLTESETFK